MAQADSSDFPVDSPREKNKKKELVSTKAHFKNLRKRTQTYLLLLKNNNNKKIKEKRKIEKRISGNIFIFESSHTMCHM